MKRGFTLIELIVVVVILTVLVTCMGLFAPLDALWHLATGWVGFLWRNLQRIKPDPGDAVMAMVCGVAFLIGFKTFLTKRLGDRISTVQRWRFAAVATAASMLLFVSGVSIVAATHQTLWLFTSPEPITRNTFEAAGRTHSRNQLKQIGLASYNFHDDHSFLPPGGLFTADGLALHSWETQLLPHLDHEALYQQIKLEQPWTSPVQGEVFKQRIEALRNSGYERNLGKSFDTASHYAMNSHLAGIKQRQTFQSISDGSSYTVFVGEISQNPKAWGDPSNFRDPAIGFNEPFGFGSVWSSGGVQFQLADGSVRYIGADIDLNVLKALSTPNGGEEITSADF